MPADQIAKKWQITRRATQRFWNGGIPCHERKFGCGDQEKPPSSLDYASSDASQQNPKKSPLALKERGCLVIEKITTLIQYNIFLVRNVSAWERNTNFL
ncbi:hypothetical protein V5799_014255, partial [Amblyomma americanum]